MTIKQALKQKNVLATELSELYTLIRSNNSVMSGNPKHYVISDLMKELDLKLVELVSLKTKIHTANIPVYDKIFMLSELKNKVNQYKSISTVEGKINNRYSQEEPTVFEVEFNVKDVKDIVKSLELKINEIQDELDTFNSITHI